MRIVNIMTVFDHGTVQCPDARVLDGLPTNVANGGAAGINRMDSQSTGCIGPSCRSWVWLDPPGHDVVISVPAGETMPDLLHLTAAGLFTVHPVALPDGTTAMHMVGPNPVRRACCAVARPTEAELAALPAFELIKPAAAVEGGGPEPAASHGNEDGAQTAPIPGKAE